MEPRPIATSSPNSKCNSNTVCWRRQRRRRIYGAQRQAKKTMCFPLDWLSRAMIYVTVYHSPSCVISNIRTKIAQWIMCHIQRVVRALIPCEQSQQTQHAESNRFAIENNWTLALSRACVFIFALLGARCLRGSMRWGNRFINRIRTKIN